MPRIKTPARKEAKMTTEKTTEMSVAPQSAGALAASRPAHLSSATSGDSSSMALLRQYVTPPRLKVMQKMRRAPLDTEFEDGDLAVMPTRQLVAAYDPDGGRGAPFLFVPLFFYPEWLQVNPIDLPGAYMIRERTLQANSELARKARDPVTRREPHPETPKQGNKEYFVKNVECLTFVIGLCTPTGEMIGVPVTLSFSSAGHKDGRALASLIRMRNVGEIYGCVFEGRVEPRSNDSGDWFNISCSNPTIEGASPWVPTDYFDAYKAHHLEMVEAYKNELLQSDFGEDDFADGAPAAGAESKEF